MFLSNYQLKLKEMLYLFLEILWDKVRNIRKWKYHRFQTKVYLWNIQSFKRLRSLSRYQLLNFAVISISCVTNANSIFSECAFGSTMSPGPSYHNDYHPRGKLKSAGQSAVRKKQNEQGWQPIFCMRITREPNVSKAEHRIKVVEMFFYWESLW